MNAEELRGSVGARLPADTASEPVPLTISTNVVTMAMYVAVVGSRKYPELERVGRLVNLMHNDATVVSGGAKGVDSYAETAAIQRGLKVATITVPSDVASYVPALFGRNTVIVRGSDVVVAFWDGFSKGTEDTIRKAVMIHGFCIVALPGQSPEVWCR